MSVQDQIDRINGNISDAYDAVSAKGGTMPSVQNSANLATAVGSIPTASPDDFVPITRKVNGKELSSDITLTASDVSARPSTWTPTAADVGARPSTWTPTAADVGARPSSWTPTAAQVGAVPAGQQGVIPSGAIELNQGGTLANHGGYVDFHYNKSTADYTSRIEENENGVINIAAANGLKLNNKDIFKLIYPVGSIYMSVNSTNPGTLFGGTWSQIKDTFLLACGSTYANGATGGEATHKLTAAESGVPAHGHGNTFALSNNANTLHSATALSGYQSDTVKQNTSATYRYLRVVSDGVSLTRNSVTLSGSVSNNTAAAAANAHNNMPPYLAVYVWKRTA